MSIAIMSYRPSNFMETDDMFLQFEDDLDNNIAGGSSSMGDNTESSSQQTTPTPRRRAQSRLLELERHVAINGRIPMTIAPGAEKPISPHAVRDRRVRKQPYNHSSGSKSFLQRQHELAERRGQPVDRVELLRETHVRAGTFVSQAAEDAHNQMLELQSQPIPEGSQPLSEDEICDQVLGRRPGYSKGLGWGPKPKARRTASASSS
uniref:CACTA en-spm transposon protein n=1 Tax=Cucumis melo TaxID=3656 RepID=A0A9I9E2N7_CUCME